MEGLGVNLQVIITQAVTFVILLVLMRVFAYKFFMRILDERSGKIKESMDQTELVKKQAEQAEAETKERIAVASKEGQELIARASKTGDELRRQAQDGARHDAETMVARARAEIQRERDEAIDELRKEVADLTILAAEKVIDRSLDKKAHSELIDKMLEEGSALKKG